METVRHDLVVIGAGPGGYIAAIRAAQLGLSVGCVEKESALGGTCLRIGCIPSKALLEASERYHQAKHGFADLGIRATVELDLPAMLAHKDRTVKALTSGVAGLFKKHKIARYTGSGRFDGPGVVVVDGANGEAQVRLEAPHILIATGSEVTPLRGVEMDWDRIGGSTEALSWPEVPEHLVVIGAGVIGLELGSVWARLGAKVTVLEYLDRILPGMDAETAKKAKRLFEKQGITFALGTAVTGARVVDGKCVVEASGREPIVADRVLVCVGRRPYTAGLGLETIGLEPDAKGRITVDDRFCTSVPGVYAIGDVIPGPMLAHKAEHEGVACVEWIVQGWGHVDYDAIPSVVYTEPEIASVGKTEEELVAAGIPFRKGVFPFLANGRAKAIGQTDGQVKILAHAETDRILGAHILGPRAGDLIAEVVLAIEFKASAEDLAMAVHAHPTLAEAVKEAALAVDGRPLNF